MASHVTMQHKQNAVAVGGLKICRGVTNTPNQVARSGQARPNYKV